jgi:alpha-beta hydrolase superfamily lysophospholipase
MSEISAGETPASSTSAGGTAAADTTVGVSAASDSGWRPDILGAGYTQRVLDLGPDPDGESPDRESPDRESPDAKGLDGKGPDGEATVEAVLVRRSPQPGEVTTGAVLYVHGFADYFFQTDLADFFAGHGLAFYALELRKCGRARRSGQTAHYVSDLRRYDEELEQALKIVAEAHPGQPVIVAAHSTGGLVVPLWLHRRRRKVGTSKTAPVTGLVLNSPWLDLQGNWLLRGPVTQAMRLLARTRPLRKMKLRPGVYGQTLHVSGTGEWEFDTSLKPLHGFPVTFGWINAIRRGQARLHRGIDTGVPVLVLRSAKSMAGHEYSPECDRCDLVLDTRQIGRWTDAGALGDQVTHVVVDGARHDVFLSLPEVRSEAYRALGAWLGTLGADGSPSRG